MSDEHPDNDSGTRVRSWRYPWEKIPGDDGYEWSLRFARFVCGLQLLFPVLFAAMSAAIILLTKHPHEEPIITACLAGVALATMPVAPFLRERLAHAGIDAYFATPVEDRRPEAVYATFATAAIGGYLAGQINALFGFIATALTQDVSWLIAGSIISYVIWALMWPRRTLWDRWTWQSRVRRDAAPESTAGSAQGAEPDRDARPTEDA